MSAAGEKANNCSARLNFIRKNAMSAHRALIVIDVQNEYVTGNLPVEYPDVRL
jgi:hypothetical protein